MKSLGMNIQKIILEKGLMIDKVAEKTGHTYNRFNNMLHGRVKITAEDIVKIADVLDVTPNDLFGVYVTDFEKIEKKDLNSCIEVLIKLCGNVQI